MTVRADMIIAGAAIHGRMTIGEDDIVTLAGGDVGMAIDIDHIVTRAGIDRGVAGLNPDEVVTGSADNLEQIHADRQPVVGITSAKPCRRPTGAKGIDLCLKLIDGGLFYRRPRQQQLGAVRDADRGGRRSGADDDAWLNTLAVLSLVPASAAAVPACEIDQVVYDE